MATKLKDLIRMAMIKRDSADNLKDYFKYNNIIVKAIYTLNKLN